MHSIEYGGYDDVRRRLDRERKNERRLRLNNFGANIRFLQRRLEENDDEDDMRRARLSAVDDDVEDQDEENES